MQNGLFLIESTVSRYTSADETVRLPLPRLGGAVRGGDGNHDGNPHEPAADAEGVRLSGGHQDLHMLRRHHRPHHARQ